jgi:hypothetical protein
MATYGEGHAGVWAIVQDSGDYTLGRSFNLDDLVQLRQFAYDRRRPEAELNPELSDRIGELYTALRAMQLSEYHGDFLGEAAAAAFPSPASQAAGEDEDVAAAGGTLTLAPPEDSMAALNRELEAFVPDELKDQLAGIDRKLGEARKILNENPLPDMSGISREDMAAFHDARWKQVADETKIPPEMRDRLLGLLAGEGTSISAAARELGAKPWPVRKWLERLRAEGLVRIEGEKRGQRWRLNDAPESGDGS